MSLLPWTCTAQPLSHGQGWRHEVRRGGVPAATADVLSHLVTDAELRELLTRSLAAVPTAAFRWETPGLTADTSSRPFEFVTLASPGLDRRADPTAFADYFAQAEQGVATFTNLGGDAILVVPTPVGPTQAYGHLAAFLRAGPVEQQHALWAAVGRAMLRRSGARPVWLSTAGAGVPWLHVRLDNRPKYYGHAPYRAVA